MRNRCTFMTLLEYCKLNKLDKEFVYNLASKHYIKFIIKHYDNKNYNDSPTARLENRASYLQDRIQRTFEITTPTEGRQFYNSYRKEILVSEEFRKMFFKTLEDSLEVFFGIDRNIVLNLIEDVQDDVETSQDFIHVLKLDIEKQEIKKKEMSTRIDDLKELYRCKMKDSDVVVIIKKNAKDLLRKSQDIIILQALKLEDYNMYKAAELLGIGYKTLRSNLNRMKEETDMIYIKSEIEEERQKRAIEMHKNDHILHF